MYKTMKTLSSRTPDIAPAGGGELIYSSCMRGKGQMPTTDTRVLLGTLALTIDGSKKKVKDTGELTKMVDANIIIGARYEVMQEVPGQAFK